MIPPFCFLWIFVTRSYIKGIIWRSSLPKIKKKSQKVKNRNSRNVCVQPLTFSLQLDNMLIMLRQTDCTESAGDQSSVRMDKQMWPLLYTCGWTGIFSPVNITCTEEIDITKDGKTHELRDTESTVCSWNK